MRKTIAFGFVAAAALAGLAAPASAEETTVIRRDSAPSVSVERREGVVERRQVPPAASIAAPRPSTRRTAWATPRPFTRKAAEARRLSS
ncbi:hypothetical protein AFFFEF_04964 [Methylorubrum extorquens]